LWDTTFRAADVAAVPTLRGERVILRAYRESDIEDRLRHPIEEDGYGSSWRREWDGRRYHTPRAPDRRPAVHRIVDPDQHRATYAVGVFVADLRGRGLGRRGDPLGHRLGVHGLGVHRIQLEVLAGNRRAINSYLACGFRQEGASAARVEPLANPIQCAE
jgi:hypothetical protein